MFLTNNQRVSISSSRYVPNVRLIAKSYIFYLSALLCKTTLWLKLSLSQAEMLDGEVKLQLGPTKDWSCGDTIQEVITSDGGSTGLTMM